MLLINTLEAIERNVRVNLRGGNIRVTEYGLHRPQVGAVFNHVRRATVAQHVRTGMATKAIRSIAHKLPDALSGQSMRSSRQE
jgi:3-methyladenine DNA glycosylase/8-oxoguanine DNA glycosylase